MTAEVRFPAVYATVRDVVRRMTFPSPWDRVVVGGAFEEEVWRKVRAIVAEQAGVDVKEVRRRTDFVRDLNLG